MKSRKVVILNAPPNAGKDMVAQAISGYYSNVHHKEIKESLFRIAKAVAGVTDEQWDKLYTRELKEVPSDLLFGRSPREHMIHTSEELIKPVYGKDYFGKQFAKGLEEGVNLVSDGGFYEEMVPAKTMVGLDNFILIRIHREGCNFNNDSRDYLHGICAHEYDVYNDGKPSDIMDKVHNIIVQHEVLIRD